MKTIAIKELKERITITDSGFATFNCSDMSCSKKCIFNTTVYDCKGKSRMFDFKAVKEHDFGKLKRTGVFGLLMFATDENDMKHFSK
jgi:hypothetical protein